jgi:hypothetical protein
LIVEKLQHDLAAEQAAAVVDDLGPRLVAALDPLAGLGEVPGQRQRDTDHDPIAGSGLATAAAAGGHQRDDHHRRGDSSLDSVPWIHR